MFIIDFRNKNVSEYRFSVMGNSNVDKVNLVSRFTQYATNTSIYLKVESVDENYVDKIAIASENISIDEDTLVCKWTMGIVSTQCKKLRLQLQFEQGETIIAQTGIVNLTLADTINVDELIPVIYPQILKQLQDQIDTLKADSVAGASMSYANDTLSLILKNKDNETLTSLQVEIKLSDKLVVETYASASELTIAELFEQFGMKPFIYQDMLVQIDKQPNNSYLFSAFNRTSYTYHSVSGNRTISDVVEGDDFYEYITQQNIAQFTQGKVDKTSSQNKVYGTNNNGEQITIDVDYGITNEGKIVRRSGSSGEANQIYVPLTPTQNGHATSKKYVDDLVQTIKENHIVPVDTSTYPTLNDFLASTGEEGNIYIYPKDISDLSKGYYMYVWEGNAWVYLGDNDCDHATND